MKRGIIFGGMIVALVTAGLAGCDTMSEPKRDASPMMPPTDGSLTHRYSFTDAAKDSVGKVDGVLKGSAKVSGGKLVLDNGSKTSDDASLSYVEFSGSLLPKGASASFVFWFSGPTAGPNFPRVIDIGDKEGVEGRAFIYYTPRTQTNFARAAITATTTANRIYIDSAPIDDGVEHCVIIVIDGEAKKLREYVDGKEVGTAADLGENTLDKVRPVHNWIGRSAFDPNGGLSGSINEFRVYSRALSAGDAAAIAKAGADVVPARATVPAGSGR